MTDPTVLIPQIVAHAETLMAWKRKKDPKRTWTGHDHLSFAALQNDVTEGFAQLTTLLKTNLPAHWCVKGHSFALPSTQSMSFVWGKNGKSDTKYTLSTPLLALFYGIMEELGQATKPVKALPARLKTLPLAQKPLLEWTIYNKHIPAFRARAQWNSVTGTSLPDAIAHLTAQNQYVPIPALMRSARITKSMSVAECIALGNSIANGVRREQPAWTIAPTLMDMLEAHPVIKKLTTKRAFSTASLRNDVKHLADLEKTLAKLLEQADTVAISDKRQKRTAYCLQLNKHTGIIDAWCPTSAMVVGLYKFMPHNTVLKADTCSLHKLDNTNLSFTAVLPNA